MKLATEEELAGHHAATVRGAIEGVAAGFAISIPGTWYLNRNWTYFRKLPIQLKALGIVMVVAPLYAIQAERRGVEFDQSTWTGAGKNELDRLEKVEQNKWEALTTKEKIKTWAMENQYKVILGSWAASMLLAGGIVWRNKYQTPAQKVVQARMWAQGLTVGVLIAAGIATQAQRKSNQEHKTEDHSWVGMVEEIEREEAEKASHKI
ncbi:RCF1 family protein [Abortiporus biennis]